MMVGLLPAGIAHAQGDTHTEECYAEDGELICNETVSENVVEAGDSSAIKAAVEQLAASESEKSGTIRITSNIALTEQITIPKGVKVTIIGDGENHKLCKSDDAQNGTTLFVIADGAEFTIDGDLTLSANKDGNDLIKCYGKLTLKNGTLDFADFKIPGGCGIVSVWGKNAEFTMEGGRIQNADINACSAGVRVCGGGSFTMNGGTISGIKAGGSYESGAVLVFACDNGSSLGEGTASFTMNDGVIENNSGYRGAGVFVIGREFNNRASMTMNGGIIRNNTCEGFKDSQAAGAGVYVERNAEFTMNDGEISGNIVDMGEGGGICVACGWESVAGTPGWNIDLFSRYYPAAFTMNGGTIRNNQAKMNTDQGDNGCGGGIYVASHRVTLNGGVIENNTAEKQGGGVYVGATPYILKIHNAVVKDNHASILGGGLWACPTGDVELFVTNGAALYDNSSDGAGDDLVSVKIPSKKHSLTLADRALGGGQVFWHKDGGVDSSSVLGFPDSSQRYSADASTPMNPIREYGDSVALKAIMSDGAKAAAMSASSLIIQGNEAPRGGGIGTNGGVILGDEREYDYKLQVKKTWTDAEDSLKVPVTVYLKLGDHVLDSVELNEANNWTASFTGLPDPKTLKPLYYAVVEDPVPENFTPSYTPAEIDEDARTILITVDNRYTPAAPTGDLTVSKVVAGNAGDTSKAFSFTVKLSDNTINGNYGDMTFADGAATFTLKHNEQKTASGLPAGITYEVTETEANQNGYTTTSTGASGSIVKDQTVTAAYVNTKNSGGGGSDDDDAYGSLTVSKTVAGTAADLNQSFTFTIKLDRSISGTYGDMRFDKGVAVITLKHGESSTATRLPAGIHYTVTESDHDGYTVTADGDTGVIRDGKTAVAAFTNTKDSNIPNQPNNPDKPTTPDQPSTPEQPDTPNQPTAPVQPSNPGTPDHTPKTDDSMNLALWISLMGFSLTGLFISLAVVKKNSYHGKRVK